MPETTNPPLFEVELPPVEPSKGKREHQAFLRLLPQLLSTHRGKYVAIHEGQVVDFDEDDIRLIKRVHGQIGYVPIYVGQVTEDVPIIRIPHYREYQPKQEIGIS